MKQMQGVELLGSSLTGAVGSQQRSRVELCARPPDCWVPRELFTAQHRRLLGSCWAAVLVVA